MQFKYLWYALSITTYVVSTITLPSLGRSSLRFSHPVPFSKSLGADLGITAHPSTRDRGGISARSPEDLGPVIECKRARLAASVSEQALYRR